MKEIICINGHFTSEQIAIIPNRPTEGHIDTIRDIFKTRNGIAILLNNIHNPHNGEHYVGQDKFTFEPSFAASRFTDLLGNPLNEEELLEEFSKTKIKTPDYA